ncbi:related to two-component histidine kinase chk-1 [Cephalotrichum gorgonifer]|uniref:histidine kinase n=1 Tax=Cephalotrichum gorgonifer TaxID=2041049 RepID=A0AAE8N034_9PEZI|nr:related to two-component histidine kinase chk-1 [Cephalotrichum gorgonifer]
MPSPRISQPPQSPSIRGSGPRQESKDPPSRTPLKRRSGGSPGASLSPSSDLAPQRLRDDISPTTSPPNLPLYQTIVGVDGTRDQDSEEMAAAQAQVAQYRQQLARDLEMRERSARSLVGAGEGAVSSGRKAKVSPIEEEDIEPRSETSPTPTPNPTTTSTESGNTIRGGAAPSMAAATPSYPFPRMSTGNLASSHHSPLNTIQLPSRSSSTFSSPYFQPGISSSSAASAVTFGRPPDGEQRTPNGHQAADYPTPNLYDLSLMLTAESGLDSWWETVVQIMVQVYKAERVTLAVPADSTDIENVPWGQKAVYNGHPEDELSLGYMARSRGDSTAPSYQAAPSELPLDPDDASIASPSARPGLKSRHSFTTFEDRIQVQEEPPRRPGMPSRSQTCLPSANSPRPAPPHSGLSETALEQLAATDEDDAPTWEDSLRRRRTAKARVLPVMQALDYEADPLTSHDSIMSVLKRGKVIALTRTYPYLQVQPERTVDAPSESAREERRMDSNSMQPEMPERKVESKTPGEHEGNRPGRLKARFEEQLYRSPSPKYEEYEQMPPSPWSQSPAPSPAIRADPKENPFFNDAFVDESSFSPEATPADYSAMPVPEAIGVDNSSSVLHIPLNHLLLSQMRPSFRFDSGVATSESQYRNAASTPGTSDFRGEHSSHSKTDKLRTTPIAVLSILSPVIPYPVNLRHSLDHLSLHLATTFALCRHHTALETELAGLKRRKPSTPGFGALGVDGRPVMNPTSLANAAHLHFDDLATQSSFAGSMTSLSEYSGISRSAVCSPGPTPGAMDQTNIGSHSERTCRQPYATSPLATSEDGGYFSIAHKPITPRGDVGRRGRSGQSMKEGRSSEKRRARGSSVASSQPSDSLEIKLTTEAHTGAEDLGQPSSLPDPSLPPEGSATPVSDATNDDGTEAPGQLAPVESTPKARDETSTRKPLRHRHTMLHSYGADFSTTFPSLPPSSTLSSRPTIPVRSGTTASTQPRVTEMPPPSDKLKGLILDSLPAHVFVALPQSGEVVWVSSRYLSYRGLTVSDLVQDPWGSIHVEDREGYLKAWSHFLRTGEPFFSTVRIRRFDGAYRWFYARAIASKDKRGVIQHFLGSYMDIHDQRIAEINSARQEQLAASEAKHKLLANLIPQIIFTATHTDGITSANDQWLSYTGQSFEDSLGLGFMDYVHPEDLARCRIPIDPDLRPRSPRKNTSGVRATSGRHPMSPDGNSGDMLTLPMDMVPDPTKQRAFSSHDPGVGKRTYEPAIADLAELAKKEIIKVARDSNGRLSYTTEVRLRSKSGEYRWHLVRCVEIDNIDFGDGVSSYFGSATDINDHKLLEAKLKEAMDSKSRFLSNMSHEIRTPLIGISGMVSFLQDTELNEEQRDHTNTIQTSANSLLMIINDILDLSKVAAGMMKLNFEWFHSRALIEDVNELVSTMAIAKRLELNYIVDEEVPAMVKGDKIRIRQVLLNVIGNAIKFTSEGEVFSRCKVYRGPHALNLSRNEIMLEFAITDTGRGFTKEEAELIFKPFSQIDGSSTRQHGGSGLGLVISRQLVELHGGTMDGTAVPGKGSTFTFTAKFGLPTADDHPDVQPNSPVSFTNKAEAGIDKDTVSPIQPRRSRASSQIGQDFEAGFLSSGPQSSGSSNLSSVGSPHTERSSVPSVNIGLARFSEAAKATGHDLSQVTLTMPRDRTPPDTATDRRPLMYSILIVCPQTHSREATRLHIATTIPKDVPYHITVLDSADKASKVLSLEGGERFTHVVLNLPAADAVLSLLEQTVKLVTEHRIIILVLSDTVQRQQVTKLAAGTGHEKLLALPEVSFVYKPVKPSRFAVIFDPERVRDLSIDRNRSTAQRMLESQKASYLDIVERMGNKGYNVLLVEDNPVNQKVLHKYLDKVGVGVDLATDGVDCTDMVFSKPYGYYSLILCDLHMPRKDGYHACQEIRQWEDKLNKGRMPIIALSANVMSDVQEKCMAAGFSDYVTKPVDFIDLSRAMSKFF